MQEVIADFFRCMFSIYGLKVTGGGEGRGAGKAIKGFPQIMALGLDDKVQSK